MNQLKCERTVEIYGLYDPDSNELRYVGKAFCSEERLKHHISESRTETRPVCLWVKFLISEGKLPRVGVLETVPVEQWKAAERRLIAEHRRTSNLLNLAPGGDMPSCTREQRVAAAKAANEAQAKVDPKVKAFWKSKRDYARFATTLRKSGNILEYWCVRFDMHRRAKEAPHLFGDWLLYGR